MKVSVAELGEAKEKRLKKYGKIRKSKRSLGISISMGAKIHRQQMVSEAPGSEDVMAGLLKDEGSSAGLLEEEDSAGLKQEGSQKKKKIVRLDDGITEAVLTYSFPPYPRIPAWSLALQSEDTQELYRKSLAYAEMLEKQHENRYQQAFYKGYIE